MSNTVSHPIALRLKEAGWVKRTEKVYRRMDSDKGPQWSIESWEPAIPMPKGYRLHAPNVVDIGEELKRIHYKNYYQQVVHQSVGVHRTGYEDWLYSVMHDANALAEVWIWTTPRRTSQASGTNPKDD